MKNLLIIIAIILISFLSSCKRESTFLINERCIILLENNNGLDLSDTLETKVIFANNSQYIKSHYLTFIKNEQSNYQLLNPIIIKNYPDAIYIWIYDQEEYYAFKTNIPLNFYYEPDTIVMQIRY